MQGLDKFREYMSGFRSHYVVIGGLATVLTLEDRGLPARATKDPVFQPLSWMMPIMTLLSSIAR